MDLTCREVGCGRTFGTEQAFEDHALALHSHSEVRVAVAKALRQAMKGPPRVWAYVVDVADDWFVYEVEDSEDLYRRTFSFSGGVATLTSEPVKVVARTVYEPIEG